MSDLTSTHSTYFEKLAEHIFIAELLQEVLLRHRRTVDVLRAEIDNCGYDLALECNGGVTELPQRGRREAGRTEKLA